MNNGIELYRVVDNRPTNEPVRFYRSDFEQKERPLHPAWIFIAICVGFAVGNWLFG